MTILRNLALATALAAGAFAASAAAAKPIVPIAPGALVTPHRFCAPLTFVNTFRAGMNQYRITYRVDRHCRTTIVRIVRVPIYEKPRHRMS